MAEIMIFATAIIHHREKRKQVSKASVSKKNLQY